MYHLTRLFAALALLCAFIGASPSPSHATCTAPCTKAQIDADTAANFGDNNVRAITPQVVRTWQNNFVNSIMPNAPVGNGNLACYDGTTGLLKDCGFAPTGVVAVNYYVAPTGSDSNTCLSSGSPCLTIQGAANKAAVGNFGLGGAQINIADGTYTGAVSINGTWLGAGPLSIVGDCATPGNVLLNVASGNAITVRQAAVNIMCAETRTAGAAAQLLAQDGGTISFSNMRFGGSTGQHITAKSTGIVYALGNYTIVGGGESHWHAEQNGYIEIKATNGPGSFLNDNSPLVITLTGTPNFTSYFAGGAYYGAIYINIGVTFSGSATGTRYLNHDSSTIFSGGLGTSGLPGNAAGSLENFSVYDGFVSGGMISSQGFFGIGPPSGGGSGAPTAVVADTLLTANSNTVAGATPSLTGQFHFVGADGAIAGGTIDAYGSPQPAVISGRTAFGTAVSPTGVVGPVTAMTLAGVSLDSSGAYGTNATVDLLAYSTQTSTDHGGVVRFRTVPVGSTTLGETARLGQGFSVGSVAVEPGAGIINAANGYRLGNAAPSNHVLLGNGTSYVDGALGSNAFNSTAYLSLGGGTMSGAINMGGQAITNGGALTGTSISSPVYTSAGSHTFESNGTTFAGLINLGQQWYLGTTSLTPATGTELTVSQNVGGSPATSSIANILAQYIAQDTTIGLVTLDTFGAQGFFGSRYSGGTQASRTAAPGGLTTFSFGSQAFDTSAYGSGAALDFATSASTWSGTNHGMLVKIRTVADGTTTLTERWRIYDTGGMNLGSTLATLATAEFGMNKISASGSAPGAGTAKLAVVAGTTGGSCKLIMYAGTSTTPTTVIDNVGSGC